MTPTALTPAQFDEALSALEWKGTDFCDRTGLVPNTVWRWRKEANPIPLWVGEYLRAMLALQRLHAEFVAPRPHVRASAGASTGDDGKIEGQ
ncbi:MAG: hypothetical protein RJA98_1579 [Pseudomonadota bacterium]